MGNAGHKAAEFAEMVKEGASDFIEKLVGDANTFATLANLVAAPPSKPFPVSDEELQQTAEQAYPGLDIDAINIGVYGGPGTGKLSLINALLQQPRSAAIPIVADDEVKVATQFADPTLGHIRIWYLPDEFGEEDVPGPDYFFERCFYAFDVLLILIASNRIRPGDIELAKQAYITDPPTPIVFLRSKMDGLLITGIGRVPDTKAWDAEKERISARMRVALRKQLDETNLHDAPVFLVSQAGVLDVNGKEPNHHRYVVDEYKFYSYLAQALRERRYSD